MNKFIKSFFIWSFKDWFWFHFVIKRDEFHEKLNLNVNEIEKGGANLFREIKRIKQERARAHKLDEQYSKLEE